MSSIARIECLRVEGTTPIQHFAMPLVARIGNRFKILCVSSDSADVLGRAGALPFRALRICYPGLRGWRAFELDIRHPAIAKVIVVFKGERRAVCRQQLADQSPGGIKPGKWFDVVVE